MRGPGLHPGLSITPDTVRDVRGCGNVGSMTATDQGTIQATPVRPSGSGPVGHGHGGTVLIGGSPDQGTGERVFGPRLSGGLPDPYHARQVSSPIGAEEIGIDVRGGPWSTCGMDEHTNTPEATYTWDDTEVTVSHVATTDEYVIHRGTITGPWLGVDNTTAYVAVTWSDGSDTVDVMGDHAYTNGDTTDPEDYPDDHPYRVIGECVATFMAAGSNA